MASRSYTQQQREAAIHRAECIGVAAAARELGIPKSTVGTWCHKARDRQFAIEQSVGARSASPAVAVDEAASTVQSPQLEAEPPSSEARQPARVESDQLVQERPAAQQRRVARRYTPSEKACIIEYSAKHGPAKASRHFSVSRFSLHEWRRRLELAAQGKGIDPTSGPCVQQIEGQRDREILNEWKRHPGLGPSQIRNQLRRAGIKVSVYTVRRVMEEAGYRPPKVKRHEHTERFESLRPNHMWHMDFVHRHINRASTFTLILIDDYSRYVVGHGVDDAERADMVLETFSAAVTRHGRPEMVMHDKGSAFWSWRGISRFTHLLCELGIDQVVAECKEWNGKSEVFNANLAKEFFDTQHFYDVAQMKRRLCSHLRWYNQRRTHHALGGLLVPADRYHGRCEEVMAAIESGATGRDLDDFDLSRRPLELFKVLSTGGVPELYLMGKKLLSLA